MAVRQGKLIVFSAPSGSGKTTIVKHLLTVSDLNLAFSISATSRYKREGEIDGKDYYFISPKEFHQKITENAFLEYEEVYKDNYYGTLKSEIERIWAEGKNVVFDIDVVGGMNIKKQYPEQTLAIFVNPPSVEELGRRLRFRQTESDEKIEMRLAKAERELSRAPEFDVVLENNDLEIAKQEAENLVSNFIKG